MASNSTYCPGTLEVPKILDADAIVSAAPNPTLNGGQSCVGSPAGADWIGPDELEIMLGCMDDPVFPSVCDCCQYVADGDIDLWDFAQFQRDYTGLPKGACCSREDGTCTQERFLDCYFEVEGTYHGNYTTCEEVVCPFGACCSPDGTCADEVELGCAFAGGVYLGDGTRCENATCPEIRYRNTDSSATVHAPGAGVAMADDILLEGTALCGMVHYDLAVLGGGGDVTASLYTHCPGNGGTLIEGTEMTWTDIPFDGFPVFLDANFDIPVTLPANNQVWLVVEFSDSSSGWIFAGEAEAGFGSTADIFGKDLPPWGCNGYFDQNYAGFWANVACVDPAGACCLGNGSCVQVDTPEECAGLGGLYAGSLVDCIEDAVDCTGACCAGDGSCSDVARDYCSAEEYQGDGVDCLSGTCIGACCLSGETCSEMGADACAAAAGYYRGHGTVCLGSNCNRGACCVVGPCLDVTEEECPGFYLGDETTCLESTCPTMGACCRDGVCIEETEDDCVPACYPMLCILAEGHTWNEGVACGTDPCGSPPPPGVCCLEFGDCVEGITPLECADLNGTFKDGYSLCSEVICAQPQTGACCFDSAPCVEDQTEAQCVFNGGEFLGTLSDCTPDPCGPTGACCMPNGDCVADQTTAECIAATGAYQGDASVCTPNLCPEPTGACCMRDDTCQEPLTAADCGVAGGTYQGDSSTCGGLDCKVTGACCLPAANCMTNCVGLCHVLTASACAYQGGGYAGDGMKCSGQGAPDCSDCNDGPTVFGTCQTDERTQVVADDAAVSAKFGYAVSLSGDIALVGAPGDESFGSAYVIRLGCGGGQTKLRESDPRSGENFGKAVAMSGDTAVVLDPPTDFLGPPGVAYVFQKPLLGWGDSMVETARLMISDPDATLGPPESVAINETEDIILFGHPYDCEPPCVCLQCCFDQGCGSVYVYHRPALGWGNHEEDFILTADDFDAPPAAGKDRFGHAVSISGLVALVGAPGDYVSSGSAYIFRYDVVNSIWSEEAKLTACDPDAGDQFGTSVSISGDVAVVGAPYDNDAGSWSGSAYVFRFDPQTDLWHQEAKLTASDGAFNDRFGFSVSISGDLAVIGVHREEDTETNSGSMYVFRFDGFDWNEEAKLTASDASSNDRFGTSVSVDGDRAVAGAISGEGGATNSGAAYVFEGLGDCDDSQTTDLCDIINNPTLDCCPPHDCCDDTHGPGCSDAGIAACVCVENKEIECCTVDWDATCVALVESIPCGTCDPGGNGIIDTCEACPADFDGDGDVDAADLAELLGAWGPCPGGCQEDLSLDCVVGAFDLAILLGCWGSCPCSAQAQWNGGPDKLGALRFALGGGPGCLSLEDVVQMMGYADIGEFIEWVLSEVPPEWVYQVAQFVLWLLEHWPC
ncbi:MAG: FG-GAP repeat protein [Planctomycetes bacterium]|nr:FG-GAP repeat protein [Planctomycetota bacterium]